MRGILTDNIQKKAKEFLKREITVKELRLYPYIDYSIKNNCQGWSFTKITPEEKEILDRLMDEKHLVYSPEKIIISRQFYDYMQNILALSYVEEFL